MSKQESAHATGEAGGETRARNYVRSEFRVLFPPTDRPNVRIGEHTYPVWDLSESAVSIIAPRFFCEQIDAVECILVLPEGDEIPVKGSFLRCGEDRSVLKFDGTRIPYRTILQLQQELIRKYPDWAREHAQK